MYKLLENQCRRIKLELNTLLMHFPCSCNLAWIYRIFPKKEVKLYKGLITVSLFFSEMYTLHTLLYDLLENHSTDVTTS
jgi:hypothetical protein